MLQDASPVNWQEARPACERIFWVDVILVVILMELGAVGMKMFQSSDCRHCNLNHHLLLQHNPEWLDIPAIMWW